MKHRLVDTFNSLRFRITLWNTAALLFTLVVSHLVVREGVRYALVQARDARLIEDGEEVKATIRQQFPDRESIFRQFARRAATHTLHGFYMRVFDEERNMIWQSDLAPAQLTVPVDMLERVDELFSSGQLRLLQVRIEEENIPRWTIRVATSYARLDAMVNEITNWVVMVFLAALIIVPLVGYWLAGRATQPIAEIIRTTAFLKPQNLHARLPMRQTGDELDQLSRTINSLLDRIGEFVQQNREFTANAAHELRSPLAAIQAAIEVNLDHPRTPEEYRELLSELLEQAGGLSQLVSQLLTLAENESGELAFDDTPVDLQHLVRQSLDFFDPVAELKGVSLSLGRFEEGYANGSSLRLRQVISNLIDNAIKYTPPHGEVVVEVVTDSVRRLVSVIVSDTGRGIPANDLPKIFHRFYRGDRSRERSEAGVSTGLGLAICRAIVHAHGGVIMVDSHVGEGTTFSVHLPLAIESAAPSDSQTMRTLNAQTGFSFKRGETASSISPR